MSRLATTRDIVLERTPARRDWWVIGWLGCLLLGALAVPPTGRPGGPGRVGALKMATTAVALVGPAAVVGYRRASPVVAAGVTWGFVVVAYFGTGMWVLSLGGSTWEAQMLSALTVDTMPLALVWSTVGYVAGVAAWGARRAAAEAAA